MFRRGTDYSWPLILVLAVLFFFSLRLPRQWEAIARHSRLELVSGTPIHAETSPSVSQDDPSKSDLFRAIRPADRFGRNASLPETSSEKTTDTRCAAVSDTRNLTTPTENTILAGPAIVPAAKTNPAPLVSVVAVQSESPQAESPSPVRVHEIAPTDPQLTENVRVLRDVDSPESVVASTSEIPASAGPSTQRLPSPNAERNASGVRRLPPPDSQASPVEDSGSNPLRAVAPEPEVPASKPTAALRATSQPVLPQANPVVSTEVAKSEERFQPAETVQPVKPGAATGPVSKASAEPPMKVGVNAWVAPAHLLLQLNELAKHEATRAWASDASTAIQRLGPAISVGAPETSENLRHLDLLIQETPALLRKGLDESVAQNLSRTSYALERHVIVWNQIEKMGGMNAAGAPAPAVDPGKLNKCLSEIDQLTSNSAEGHAWRKYLLIESLRDWAAGRRNGDERLPRELGQQVLKRLNPMSVSSRQRQFLTSGPMAELQREMLRHTAEPVAANRLLQSLESYEASGRSSDARLLARDCELLDVGSGTGQRELGERFEMLYRNANLRIAVTADLLNRMIPKREPEFAPVQDRIQGAQVRGQSLMASEVSVRLIPDPHHVRLALQVNGEMASETRSTSGPATFYSDSESSYLARKPVEITLRGISMGETEVAVNNNSQLRGVSTSFGSVPIFGRIAKSISEQQYDEKKADAEAEIRGKIAAKAKERVDREASAEIAAAAKRLDDEVIGPMDSLMLNPTMIAAETTDKRFSMRIRLAGPDQLGGHTPRPQAPADSLASIQIHESMLNNMLDRLELDGETFDLAGLGKRLSERLQRFKPKAVDPDQEDVKITFAANDALHVRCNDGRVEITLAIARLSKGARKWKDFQIRAVYRPVVQGRSVDLVRDGVVQLVGPRISIASQIALRGVFSKVFSQKEPIHVTPEAFVKNPKLQGLVITQFVIDDGWIGAAIGPQRTVTSQRMATWR
jgi:hypothetical protein